MAAVRRVAAVASDPGSTNALAPVVRGLEAAGATAWIGTSGQAAAVWDGAGVRAPAARLADAIPVDAAEGLLRGQAPDVLLTGAGAFNRLEHTFRLAARGAGVPAVAILDDRGDYRERFGRPDRAGWMASTPGRICVMDEGTRDEMVRAGFDPAGLRVTGQPHLEQVERFFAGLSPEDVRRRREAAGLRADDRVIAFFSEQLAEALGPQGPAARAPQLDALASVIEALAGLTGGGARPLPLLVKPHPREDPEPLRRVLAEARGAGLHATLLEGGSGLDVVALADVVVGMLSMVLVEAGLGGKPTLSIQIGHPRVPRWWGGIESAIRVATSAEALREMLAEALGGTPLPGRPPTRFRGATEAVIGVLAEVLRSTCGARGASGGMPGAAPPALRGQ